MSKQKTGFSYLFEYASPHKNRYVLSLFLAIISVLFYTVPYFMVSKILIGLIDLKISSKSYYLSLCLIAAVAYLLHSIFHSFSTTVSHYATFRVISEIRMKIAKKLTRVPMGYVLETPSGELKNSMVEKVDSIEPTLAHVLPEMTSNLLVPVLLIIILFFLDWRMALMSMATFPIGMLGMMGMMKDYDVKFKEMSDIGKHMNATAVEYVNGIEVIKAFGQSASSYEKFSKAVKLNASYGIDWMSSIQKYYALGIGVFPNALLGVLPLGTYFLMTGSLGLSTFITIIILVFCLTGPLMKALNLVDALAKINIIMEDIGNILTEKEVERPNEIKNIERYDIELKNVEFGYKKEKVIKNVSLNIKEGTVNAFVGPSGGGKSTIAKLIASFWDVDSGTISIGNIPLTEIPAEQINNLIAFVDQDNFLFDKSVMDNIRMGDLSASDEKVMEIAKASGCHGFILNLEKGYETIVGGSGSHLSGGERQRISIARAMLKNAPIIVFDEATAFTDPENEAVIQKAVGKLVKGKTLIVIAHRLSTIVDSDEIFVIKDGKIDSQGTHNQLLESSPLYKSLWNNHIASRDDIKGDE